MKRNASNRTRARAREKANTGTAACFRSLPHALTNCCCACSLTHARSYERYLVGVCGAAQNSKRAIRVGQEESERSRSIVWFFISPSPTHTCTLTPSVGTGSECVLFFFCCVLACVCVSCFFLFLLFASPSPVIARKGK